MKLKNLDLSQFKFLAAKLARQHRHKAAVIGLVGPLGAGKTTFVQSFCRALGVKRVKSPSFIIAHRYRHGRTTIHHFDLYRLHSAAQLEVLGLTEILEAKGLVLIEWVDKFPRLAKRCNLIIRLQINPRGGRDVTIQTHKI